MDALLEQLLLPLLGGFLFVLSYYRLRFLTLRTSAEKLVLIAGVVAIGLGIIGKLVSFSLYLYLFDKGGSDLVAYWRGFWVGISPFPFSNTLAFLAGPTIGLLLNKGVERDEAYTWALEKLNDNFELMLDRSLNERQPILITLHSGRVYVGVALSPASPTPHRTHFRILPLWSGYRVPLGSPNDPGRVTLTTDYQAFAEVIEAMREANLTPGDKFRVRLTDGSRSIDFDPENMGILMSKNDVETITYFDIEVYAFLNRDREPDMWADLSEPLDPDDGPAGASVAAGEQSRVTELQPV